MSRRKAFDDCEEERIYKKLDGKGKPPKRVWVENREGKKRQIDIHNYMVNPNRGVLPFRLLNKPVKSGDRPRPVVPTGNKGNEYLKNEIISVIVNDFTDQQAMLPPQEIKWFFYQYCMDRYYFFDDSERIWKLVDACLSDALAVRTTAAVPAPAASEAATIVELGRSRRTDVEAATARSVRAHLEAAASTLDSGCTLYSILERCLSDIQKLTT